jgi:outer membrane immunogenic protein
MAKRARLLGCVAACVLAAGTAGAADLGAAPTLPMAPLLYSWSGCYVGGFIGGASAKDPVFTDLGNTAFAAFSGGLTAPRVEASHSWSIPLGSGGVAGGNVGCNWQPFASNFVVGVEAEAAWLSMSNSEFDRLVAPNLQINQVRFNGRPDVLGSASVGDWYAMVTGRLGYAMDRVLIYGKGGVAFVPVSAAVLDACFQAAQGCGNFSLNTFSNDTVATWTAGGGIEWAWGINWSAKVEYMFIGQHDAPNSCGTATDATGAIVPGGQFCFSHAFDGIHTAKIGLNYRWSPFGGP